MNAIALSLYQKTYSLTLKNHTTMDNQIISDLQPLFCTRASLLKAQEKMNDNTELDCQLVLRFADGTQQPLNIKRADIENMLLVRIYSVEQDITAALEAAGTSSDTSEDSVEETTSEETANE